MSKRDYANLFVVQTNPVSKEMTIDLIHEVVETVLDPSKANPDGTIAFEHTKEQEMVARIVMTHYNASELARVILNAIQLPAPESGNGQ